MAEKQDPPPNLAPFVALKAALERLGLPRV